jgi:FtsZ-binding cell division protein ZapB
MLFLAANPTLRPTNSLAGNFWNNSQNTSFGKFALAEKAFSDAFPNVQTTQSNIELATNTLAQKLETLKNVDNSLQSDPNNSSLNTQKENLITEIETLYDNRTTWIAQLESSLASNLSSVSTLMNNLPQPTSYELVLKTLLQNQLKYAQHISLTEADFTNLRNQISQCEKTAGVSVRLLATWLPKPESYSYSDENYHHQFCTQNGSLLQPSAPSNGQISILQSAENDIAIWPNPVSTGEFTVKFNDLTQSGTWNVSDLNGRTVTTWKSLEGESEFKLNTEKFPAGIFVVQFLTNSGVHYQKKLVVFH